jgi:hypothetical protein
MLKSAQLFLRTRGPAGQAQCISGHRKDIREVKLRPRRALVTGASGYIGSRLAQRLLACGWDMHVLVRATSNLDLLAPVRQALPLDRFHGAPWLDPAHRTGRRHPRLRPRWTGAPLGQASAAFVVPYNPGLISIPDSRIRARRFRWATACQRSAISSRPRPCRADATDAVLPLPQAWRLM